MLKYFEEVGFDLLSITAAHAAAIDELPPVHGDPVDRLLVAQALAEPLRMVSQDTRVLAYSDSFIRC